VSVYLQYFLGNYIHNSKSVVNFSLLKSKSAFLAFDFDFIYAGTSPAYKVNVKRKKPLTLILYAGFSPAYPMKPKASSKKDFKDFKRFKWNILYYKKMIFLAFWGGWKI
jgi:hypothetical protein